jgi:hypothetical protein
MLDKLDNIEVKLVRFADDDTYQKLSVNMNEFRLNKEFDDEMFGWYGNLYVAIKKDKNEYSNNSTRQ